MHTCLSTQDCLCAYMTHDTIMLVTPQIYRVSTGLYKKTKVTKSYVKYMPKDIRFCIFRIKTPRIFLMPKRSEMVKNYAYFIQRKK